MAFLARGLDHLFLLGALARQPEHVRALPFLIQSAATKVAHAFALLQNLLPLLVADASALLPEQFLKNSQARGGKASAEIGHTQTCTPRLQLLGMLGLPQDAAGFVADPGRQAHDLVAHQGNPRRCALEPQRLQSAQHVRTRPRPLAQLARPVLMLRPGDASPLARCLERPGDHHRVLARFLRLQDARLNLILRDLLGLPPALADAQARCRLTPLRQDGPLPIQPEVLISRIELQRPRSPRLGLAKDGGIGPHFAHEPFPHEPAHAEAPPPAPLLHVTGARSPVESIRDGLEFCPDEVHWILRQLRKRPKHALVVLVMLQAGGGDLVRMRDVLMELPLPPEPPVQVDVLRLSSRVLGKAPKPLSRRVVHHLEIPRSEPDHLLLDEVAFACALHPLAH